MGGGLGFEALAKVGELGRRDSSGGREGQGALDGNEGGHGGAKAKRPDKNACGVDEREGLQDGKFIRAIPRLACKPLLAKLSGQISWKNASSRFAPPPKLA